VTAIVIGKPSGPVDIVVPANGAVTPVVVMTLNPSEAATIMTGDPLASYEVDATVPLCRVAAELVMDEGSAEASVAFGR
jgi:hypothetical protein